MLLPIKIEIVNLDEINSEKKYKIHECYNSLSYHLLKNTYQFKNLKWYGYVPII